MDELAEIKLHLSKQLSEETIDAIEVMIDLKIAEMLDMLAEKLTIETKS